jgi:DNA-binding XRE family transcriptional regulator
MIENDVTVDGMSARAWRLAKGYTQLGLAEALGLSESTVNHMERGQRPSGKPIAPKEWQRYCLLCAGLHALQGKPYSAWDWQYDWLD